MLDWPAESVEKRAVALLVPNARNARLHSSEQIEQIAKSITTYGWTVPILIDEGNEIIAGHGRVMAAANLAIDEVPCIVAKDWSDEKKRAYLIADNKLTENASWDYETLLKELNELRALDCEFITGFDAQELAELEKQLQPEQEWRAEIDAIPQRELLYVAWRDLAKEWDVFAKQALERGFFSNEYTKASLGVYFVRAMLFDEDIPRAATLPYSLHRLFQAGSNMAIYSNLFSYAIDHPQIIPSFSWACGDKPSLKNLLTRSLAVHNYRYPVDFPCMLARDLIDEFTSNAAAVLDPCHGWGGRMLGFLLSKNAKTYTGFDVDERTTQGVQSMFDDLKKYVKDKDARLIRCPFEDAQLPDDYFDFALTSPPYYDVERYDGDDQSYKRYQTFEQWVDKFYEPLLEKTCRALKRNAHFALQIGSQTYPLRDTALQILPDTFEHVATRDAMENTFTQSQANVPSDIKADGEQVLIFRKR